MISKILYLKYKIINNYLKEVKKHVYFHLFVGLGILFVLILGGTIFFYLLFDFLMSQEVFGPLLMDMLIGMVFLAFFSMLIFSNLIITLTTSYISRETDFFMSIPIKFGDIFLVKFIESIIYSSWAFGILSFPFFIAFGKVRDVGFAFYPMAILLVIPFLIVPAGVGTLVTMLISAFLPARRTRTLSIILAGIAIIFSIILVRLLGIRTFLATSQEDQFSKIMYFLNMGSQPILPNFWFAKGVLASASFTAKGVTLAKSMPYLKEYLYWFAMLFSTSLMVVQVCVWLIKPLYYKGWTLSREAASKTTTKSSWIIFNFIERLLFFIPQQIRTLISKDFKTFWRDPAQWTQLIILFGLLFIYIANLKNAAMQSGGLINITIPKWKMILSFFNLAATCFILSILTTRFVYPMLSLEGKQFWVIGLAPMNRVRILWEKYWLCFFSSLILSESLIIFSNYILGISQFMVFLSILTVGLMSFGLTSLAIGIGAMTPNFREDNPARIANGLGGTLNVILSMIYIGATIALEIYPTGLHLFSKLNFQSLFNSPYSKWLILNIITFIFLHLITIYLPLKLGVRKWKKIEFLM